MTTSLPPPVTASAAPDEDLLDGRYELAEAVGRGSSAVVHRARDRHREEWVAVKVFHPGVELADPRRRRDEIEALGRLRHPGLVALRDSGGGPTGPAFVVLDLVDGPTLAERIMLGGPLPPDELRRLGARVAAALAHVHAAGIVHRDVKPANILLERDGAPRLTDFGVARTVDATSVTRAGVVVGTAAFLAPEQVRGHRVGPAADVYALGLLLLEAATGRREFQGTAAEAAIARLHRSPAVPRELPADLGRLIRSMTATDPARRPTASTVAAALAGERGTATMPTWRRPAGRPLQVAVGLIVLGGVAAAALLTGLGGGTVPTAPAVAIPEVAAAVPGVAVPGVSGSSVSSSGVPAASSPADPTTAVERPERGPGSAGPGRGGGGPGNGGPGSGGPGPR